MYDPQPPFHEIESIDELLAWNTRQRSLERVVLQGLDLTGAAVERRLRAASTQGAFFLGCRMTPALRAHILRTGGTIFPVFEGLPFDPYRATLYTPDELMQGYERGRRASLEQTVDAEIYHHFERHHRPGAPIPILFGLAYRIHDHAIDDALHELLYPAAAPPRRVIGVMGGHRMRRDDEAFHKVARLAWELARRGYFIATGGGPGAMEAANLGACLAAYDAEVIAEALRRLQDQPCYTDAFYFERAYEVRADFPDGRESLAVPTWFYGHEPSNLFATHVAKYFANSIREDGLLAIARHGVVFAPGSAGTLQEVFMDVAQNHYVTFGAASPMVFLDRPFWEHEKPVRTLLMRLAGDRPYADLLAFCDGVDEAVRFLVAHPPVPDPAA